MDLACTEMIPISRCAQRDKVIFNDDRVLNNLLDMENLYLPECNYFVEVQKDIEPYMRKMVTTWMMEVCEEQMCEDQVFPLAVNLLDRFLCCCSIARQQFQTLAAATLLIASKVRQCNNLKVDNLCAYTAHSVKPQDLRKWEILVLSKLQWKAVAVTGFDYVDHVIERVSWCRENPLIRRHAHTLVSICCTEPEFIQTLPSLVASACICAAVRGLKSPSSGRAAPDICSLTNCNIFELEMMIRYIEKVVERETASLHKLQGGEANGTTIDKQPETPVDVQDVYF